MIEATPYEVAVSLPYALAFGAVALEVAWLTWRAGAQWRVVAARARTAVTMAAGAFVVSVGYTAVLRGLWGAVGAGAPDALVMFWRAHPVVGALVAFVAWDFVGWVYHWVGHRTRVGWASHQPHHSGDTFDLTLGLRQSWTPFHGLAYQPLLALAGFDFRVIAVCAAVSNCWQVLEHTSAPVRWPRGLSAVVMTPDAHRHHHGTAAGAVNLGPVFTWWDRVAGTWVPATAPPPASYGTVGRDKRRAAGIEFAGWRELVTPRVAKPASGVAP